MNFDISIFMVHSNFLTIRNYVSLMYITYIVILEPFLCKKKKKKKYYHSAQYIKCKCHCAQVKICIFYVIKSINVILKV